MQGVARKFRTRMTRIARIAVGWCLAERKAKQGDATHRRRTRTMFGIGKNLRKERPKDQCCYQGAGVVKLAAEKTVVLPKRPLNDLSRQNVGERQRRIIEKRTGNFRNPPLSKPPSNGTLRINALPGIKRRNLTPETANDNQSKEMADDNRSKENPSRPIPTNAVFVTYRT